MPSPWPPCFRFPKCKYGRTSQKAKRKAQKARAKTRDARIRAKGKYGRTRQKAKRKAQKAKVKTQDARIRSKGKYGRASQKAKRKAQKAKVKTPDRLSRINAVTTAVLPFAFYALPCTAQGAWRRTCQRANGRAKNLGTTFLDHLQSLLRLCLLPFDLFFLPCALPFALFLDPCSEGWLLGQDSNLEPFG